MTKKEKLEQLRQGLGIKSEQTDPTSPEYTELSEVDKKLKNSIAGASTLQELIRAFSYSDIEGVQGSSRYYTSNEISELLFNVMGFKQIGAEGLVEERLKGLTNTFGLYDKAKEILAKMPVVDINKQGNKILDAQIEKEFIAREIGQIEDLSELTKYIRKKGGIVNERGEYYSPRDLIRAIDRALKNPTDPSRFDYFTRSYGFRNKATEVIAKHEQRQG